MTKDESENTPDTPSFVRKVRSRVSGIFNSSLSKLFRTPSGDSNDESRRRKMDSENDMDQPQPPPKRLKLPETSDSPSSTTINKPNSMFTNFLEPVAGPSGVSFIKNTPKPTNISRNYTESLITNGDKDSDSGESTSGYSSMVKTDTKKPKYSSPFLSKTTSRPTSELPTRTNESKHLLNFPKTPVLKSNDRSLFGETSLSPQGNHSSLSSRRPSFNTSTFGTPNFVDRTISTSRIVNSPFYNGPTIYGGASYARQLGSPSAKRRSNSFSIKPVNSEDSVINTSLSKTARRILEGLERYNTPLTDARKIPLPSKQTNRAEGLLSKYIGANPYRVKDSKVSSNRELHVPTVPELLRQKQKLQEVTEAARQIATSSKLSSNEPEYKVKTAQDQQEKHTNKIKSKISSVRTKTAIPAIEVLEDVCLKPIPLDLPENKLPKFDLIIPPPESVKSLVERKETNVSTDAPLLSKSSVNKPILPKTENFEFKFSKPYVIAENFKSVVAINNFKFSEPVSKKKVSIDDKDQMRKNGDVLEVKTISKNVNPLAEKFKPAAGTWECSVCLIRNKSSAVKCVACEAQKPTNSKIKPDSSTQSLTDPLQLSDMKTNEWECTTCLERNKDILKVCLSCQGSKPGVQNNSFGSQFKLSSGQWECTTCLIRNNNDLTKCAACESVRENNSKSTLKPFDLDKFKPSSDTWECKTCLVRNKIETEKCVACETARITAVVSPVKKTENGFGNMFKPPSDAWECSTCLIRNKNDLTKCAACETPKPGAISIKKVGDQWECPSCMVRNADNVEKCPCCGENKPGTTKTKTDSVMGFNFGDVPKFNFGIPQNAVSDTKSTNLSVSSSTPGFKTKDNIQTQSFTFGIKPVTNPVKEDSKVVVQTAVVVEQTPKETPASSFQFGVKSAAPVANNSSGGSAKISELGSQTKETVFASNVSNNSESTFGKPFTFGAPSTPNFTSGGNQTTTAPNFNLFNTPNPTLNASLPPSKPVSTFNGLTSSISSPATVNPAPMFNSPAPKLETNLFSFGKPNNLESTSANNSFSALSGPSNFGMTPSKPTNEFNFAPSVAKPVETPSMFGAPMSAENPPPAKIGGFNFGSNPSSAQASSASFTFGTAPKNTNQESGNFFKFVASSNGPSASGGFNSFSEAPKPSGFNFNPGSTASFDFPANNAASNTSGFNFSAPAPKVGGFNFSAAASAVPSFDANAKPVFNFTGGSAPSFSATPTEGSESTPRKIKRAVRRVR